MSDRKMIYLDDAIDAVAEGLKHTFVEYRDIAEKTLNKLPPAQPDYQEVLGWLLAYHTKSFDLHGRYLPHEVISWLINDFAKEFIAERGQDGH